MGMSTRIVGFKPPDEKWLKMKKIYDACLSAKIDVPDQVMDYFEGKEPDESGVLVEIKAHEWSGEDRQGYEINIDQLPKDVKIIRFYNSW